MKGNYRLYRHFAEDGQLLYIGVSLNQFARLAQHRDSSEWFTKIARVTLESYETKEAVLKAETEAIIKEQPRHNVHKKYHRLINAPVVEDAAAIRESTKQRYFMRLDLVYDLHDIAELLNVQLRVVRSFIESGELKVFNIPGVSAKRFFACGWAVLELIECLENGNNEQ